VPSARSPCQYKVACPLFTVFLRTRETKVLKRKLSQGVWEVLQDEVEVNINVTYRSNGTLCDISSKPHDIAKVLQDVL
jgi:hypothetical protein